MALSRQVIPSDGTTNQYPIAFADGYLSRDEVYVYEEFADDTPDAPIDFTFINDNLIQLSRVPPIGRSIVIERRVEASARKVIFIPQYIKSSDLNTMYKHLLYLAQAILDGRWEGSFGSNLDMGGNIIINVGKPVNDNDAVRLIDISTYTNQAQSLLDQTKTSQAATKVSETNAKASEVAAKKSEDNAANVVEGARKWAVGSIQERPEGSSKHWAEEAAKSAASIEVNTIKKIAYENIRYIECSGAVTANLQDTDEVISLKINDNTTITIDTSQLTFTKGFYTVQFYVWFPSGLKTISFSTNLSDGIKYINGVTPDFSELRGHWLVARTASVWTQLVMSDAGVEV